MINATLICTVVISYVGPYFIALLVTVGDKFIGLRILFLSNFPVNPQIFSLFAQIQQCTDSETELR